MNQKEFIDNLSKALETEDLLSPETKLKDLEEWDSLGILSTIELIESCGGKVSIEEINSAIIVQDIYQNAFIKNS
tara:strand:+ start:919 stop:1143 length:225 start_codon:yes stop_codon:yes gene_type:complete